MKPVIADLILGLEDLCFLKANNLSDLPNVDTARTNLGLVAGGAGDIWMEKAGDVATGDIGINKTSTTALQVSTDGGATNVFTVDTTNGRVGIGTTGPGAKLHVYGNINGTHRILIENANADTPSDTRLELKNDAGVLGGFFLGASGRSNYANDMLFYGNNNLTFMADNDEASGGTGFISFMTGGYQAANERMRIDSSGNVGIGTTEPTALADINSDILRLRIAKTPSSAGDTGNTGDFCWDSNYLYICIATNTWQRVAHATW